MPLYLGPPSLYGYLGAPPGPRYPTLAKVGARLWRFQPGLPGEWTLTTPTSLATGIAVEDYQAACMRIALISAADPSALLYAELLVDVGDGQGWKVNRRQSLGVFQAKDGAPFCVPEAYEYQMSFAEYEEDAAMRRDATVGAALYLAPDQFRSPWPTPDTFTIEKQDGTLVSLGQFGPVFPWSNYCAVVSALPMGSAFRVALAKGSSSWKLPWTSASALLTWRCG